MEEDQFEQAAADLAKSIAGDEQADLMKSAEAQEILKDPKKAAAALAAGVKATLAKAKGAQPTDLSQEKAVKDKDVADDEEDPAENPYPSGRGYEDSRPYVGKHSKHKMGKGHDESDDDDHDDDDDDDKKPSFFKKKKAYKGKKVHKGEESADADEVDATEFMEGMEKAIDHMVGAIHDLSKSIESTREELDEIREGSAIFGQVLHNLAENDPRHDNLLVTMAKALEKITGEVKDLMKSFGDSQDLMKSIATMPGVPRAVGLSLAKSLEGAGGDPTQPTAGGKVSEGDKGRLMKARVEKRITEKEWKHAMSTGDVSILNKAVN